MALNDSGAENADRAIMAALWNRAGHYIFALWFLYFFLFFPRLISAVADWMSTILLHKCICGPSANLECMV